MSKPFIKLKYWINTKKTTKLNSCCNIYNGYVIIHGNLKRKILFVRSSVHLLYWDLHKCMLPHINEILTNTQLIKLLEHSTNIKLNGQI